MAEPIEPTSPLPPGVLPSFVEKASPTVNVENIESNLWAALTPLGVIHLRLFNCPMIITSGRDSVHVASSKHGQGKALDLRITDKAPEDLPCFLLILRVLCRRYKLACFDESYLPGEPHIHLESCE